MFDHVSIGVREIARTKRFYDAALGALGYDCLSSDESSLGYGKGSVGLWIGAVSAPVPPDRGSNLHFCFVAPTRDSGVSESPSGEAMAKSPASATMAGSALDFTTSVFYRDPEGFVVFCLVTIAATSSISFFAS